MKMLISLFAIIVWFLIVFCGMLGIAWIFIEIPDDENRIPKKVLGAIALLISFVIFLYFYSK